MEVIFSAAWAKRFSSKWNSSTEIVSQLAAAEFDSVVAFGYIDHPLPEVIFEINHGRIIHSDQYASGTDLVPAWDLRANLAQWEKWRGNGPGISGLGVAVASRQLQFMVGDYRKMIRQPLLAGPFLKFFSFL